MFVYILLVRVVIKRYLIFNYVLDRGLIFELGLKGISLDMNFVI